MIYVIRGDDERECIKKIEGKWVWVWGDKFNPTNLNSPSPAR